MKTFKIAPKLLCGLLLAAFGGTGSAAVISTSSPYEFSWSYNTGVTGLVLTGSGSIAVSGFNSSLLTLGVNLKNTSTRTDARLTSFGFGIDPNATSVTFSDASDAGIVDAALLTQQGPGLPSIQGVEVCSFGGNNCAGGGNGGLAGGTNASDFFTLQLAGNWGASVDIAPLGFKYQTDNGSFEFTTTSTSSNGGGGGGSVPEPNILALLGVGMLGMYFYRRRGLQATA